MKITVIPNGTAGTVVTCGIPFARGKLKSIDDFRIVDTGGSERILFRKQTMLWADGSIRTAKVQWSFNGQSELRLELAPSTLIDLPEYPIEEIASTQPGRTGYKEPAFFAIVDPAYLVTTGIIPPTTVAGDNDYDKTWYPSSFAKRVSTTDFSNTVADAWLFDPVSALYQQAIRTGNAEQYREAYLEHEFYMSQMEVSVVASLCTFKLKPGDHKYVYLTPMMLHLALTGDDSWTPQENGAPHANAKDRTTFIKTIATKAMTIRGVGKPFAINDPTTERHMGFADQQLIAAYQLTRDETILANLKAGVTNQHNMQINNPDKIAHHGYLSHSWHGHEGWAPSFIGSLVAAVTDSTTLTLTNLLNDDWKLLAVGAEIIGMPYKLRAKLSALPELNADGTLTLQLATPVSMRLNEWIAVFDQRFKSDRIFSPWMQSIVADGLWQIYNFIDDEDTRFKCAALLLGFGRALVAYGIDGNKLPPEIKAQIEIAFGVTVFTGAASGSRGIVPYTRYCANTLMAGPTVSKSYIDFMNYDGAYADQHSPESLFQIALALNFETDPSKKAAMQAVAQALSAWFAAANMSKTILSSHPARYFNWTNKPNAWGTYEAITILPPPDVDPPEEDETVEALRLEIAGLNVTIAQNQETITGLQTDVNGLNADLFFAKAEAEAWKKKLDYAESELGKYSRAYTSLRQDLVFFREADRDYNDTKKTLFDKLDQQ